MTNPMTPTEQDKELLPFTSLFQNAAVARDHISSCVSEEDINELAAHIFFIEQTYKYDISKAPIDNVFSAYGIAVGKLLRTEKLKLLAEVRSEWWVGLNLRQKMDYCQTVLTAVINYALNNLKH